MSKNTKGPYSLGRPVFINGRQFKPIVRWIISNKLDLNLDKFALFLEKSLSIAIEKNTFVKLSRSEIAYLFDQDCIETQASMSLDELANLVDNDLARIDTIQALDLSHVRQVTLILRFFDSTLEIVDVR